MSKKIVLIDGHSILHRAFYGVPELTNSEGLHTNAIFGFLNIMFKILEEERPEYLTVAFDVHAPTFRHIIFSDYKGTRKPMPEELREQVPVIKEVLKSMEICVIEKAGYEADDILGSIAVIAQTKGYNVSIISGDRDLLQLSSEKIKIRIPKTKRGKTEIENYYPEDVKEKYQVTPVEFIDVKALMGDASDNIPGVAGIGEKTAIALIVKYGSIEKAYEDIDNITPKRAQTNLREHYDMAVLSKTLATICTDCELEYDIENALIKDFYTKEAYSFMKRLEFKAMLSRFDKKLTSNEMKNEMKEVTVKHIVDFNEAVIIFNSLRNKTLEDVVSFKIISDFSSNTTKSEAGIQENMFVSNSGSILGVAITLGQNENYYIEAAGFISADYILSELNEILKGNAKFVTINLKAQLKLLDITFSENIYDLELASYLINPLKDTYDYDDIARDYLGELISSKTDLFAKTPLARIQAERFNEFIQFAGGIANILYRAYPHIIERLNKDSMYKLFIDIEMPLLFTLNEMEKRGVKVEKENLKEYGNKLAIRINELEREIHNDIGEKFNINSPKQLGEILFDKLQLPHAKKTKTGYSTSADILEKIKTEHVAVAKILEYRQLTKLKSTYADGLENCIATDGRIHSTFMQTITATGRISSVNPNLQNIPVRMELGREIRKVFVPKSEYVFVDADYSQIELRVLAHMSGDEKLIAAYNENKDIHKITASEVFNVPFDEVTEMQRRNAKAVNFGIVYGISAFGLSEDLSISRKEANAYIEQYFKTYPRVKQFLDELVSDAKENGFVTTMFGRIRPVPELKSSNFMQRSFGERVAMNSPIQGTAADIIKIAMIGVERKLNELGLRSKLVLQVHDELLVEAHKEEAEQVVSIMREEMMKAAKLSITLEADIHVGNTWFESK
jgi:DNA polymerase I